MYSIHFSFITCFVSCRLAGTTEKYFVALEKPHLHAYITFFLLLQLSFTVVSVHHIYKYIYIYICIFQYFLVII